MKEMLGKYLMKYSNFRDRQKENMLAVWKKVKKSNETKMEIFTDKMWNHELVREYPKTFFLL